MLVHGDTIYKAIRLGETLDLLEEMGDPEALKIKQTLIFNKEMGYDKFVDDVNIVSENGNLVVLLLTPNNCSIYLEIQEN